MAQNTRRGRRSDFNDRRQADDLTWQALWKKNKRPKLGNVRRTENIHLLNRSRRAQIGCDWGGTFVRPSSERKKLSRIFSQSASRVISPASLRPFEIDAPVTPCIASTRAKNRLTFRVTPQKTTMSTPKTKRKPSSRTNDHRDNFVVKTIHVDHR